MLPLARSRRPVLVTATLVAALAMSGCGADTANAPGDSPGTTGTTQATTTSTTASATPTTDSATPTTEPADLIGETPLIDGELAPTAALALSERLTELLASVTDEFGDVDVDLLKIEPNSASLYFVDPARPDTLSYSGHRYATWSNPLDMPRRDTHSPLPLDAIDPEVLRSVVEAAPVVLTSGLSLLSHVSISPDESGEAEYLVALDFGTALGHATFDASGEVREVWPDR